MVRDDDRGLQQAFQAAFVEEVRRRMDEVAVVGFDKGMTNDMRSRTVAEGQVRLSGVSGMPIDQIRRLSDGDYARLVDFALSIQVMGWPLNLGARFPLSRKSEPNKVVKVPTWRLERDAMSAAI